ncbi:MAG: caspase family protein [Planctomycetota bacterium]
MSNTEQGRAVRPISQPHRYLEDVDRWAVIVGISKYRDAAIKDLKFADRDAEDLYELIRTPTGGGFEDSRICKLVNEQATHEGLRRALRSFLKKPAREDLVLIYFACHGAADPDRPQKVYLLPHDAEANDISGTGFPMEHIDDALKGNLNAQRVIIIADTCHSAAVAGGIGTRGIDDSAVINRYLQELSAAKGGLALLTSAEANEVSLEDQQWGGGHGVFTHFLLGRLFRFARRGKQSGLPVLWQFRQ